MSKKSSNTIVLVDGSSYLYRAFHAMPPLMNSKGKPTGAIYGVTNMLRKLLADHDPEYIAVVFDAKGKTFRDELFEHYKANRAEMPSDLIPQIEPIHQIIKAMGIPILKMEGVEADDVIGTLAKKATTQGIKTLVSTSDKDLAQLVDENITLVNTMSGTVLDPYSVKVKFGIPPELIIDYLALVGDTIDNIPGVPQVGPKTAVKWLLQYGSLDNIITKAAEITGKVGEKLRDSLHQLPLSRQLATIKLDVDIEFNLENLKRKEPEKENLLALFQDLEFKTWLAALREEKNQEQPNLVQHKKYDIIVNETELNALIEKLNQSSVLAFDVATTNENYMDAKIVGIAFATEEKKAAYIPLSHDYENAPPQLEINDVLKKLKPIFENKKIKKVAHNIKPSIEVLLNYDIHLQGEVADIMLQSYIFHSSLSTHDLDTIALRQLNISTTRSTDATRKGYKNLPYNLLPIEKAAIYIGENADLSLQAYHQITKQFIAEKGLSHVLNEIETPLINVLANMERKGVLIDAEKLKTQSKELEKRLQEIEKEIHDICGGSFNINSPKQLQEILFGKLQLPVIQKTPTGQPSTADPVLQELALEYPLPKLIIECRGLSKLITTYTKKLPEQINKITKRIHTSYNQTGAATGRLSSSDPNLQNIPVRTAEGRRIRQAFVAPKGYKIISADYSQIELRLMSHIAQDEGLLSAFEKNLDIHQATAAEVLSIPIDKITSEQRRSAKAINFGLIYGMSSFGLAKQLGIDRQTAQDYIDKYFARYPKVKAYMENTRNQAHKKGFVETLSGRRLYLPDINASQIMRQRAAERAAINAPLQGTAADIIKRAMISIHDYLQKNKVDAYMIMQVHDELVFEVAEKDIPSFTKVIEEHMVKAGQLSIPLVVSIGVGDNWDAASAH